ncbi:MAG TPA: NBR1-Ig-like domain-containing protein [Anaerolineales bacterium]
MQTPKLALFFSVVMVFIAAMACGILQPAQPSIPDTGALYTQAAQTVIAQITEAAPVATMTSISVSATNTAVPPSNTPEPTATPTEVPTGTPTASQVPPTNTPVPTNTPTRTPTPTPIPCLWAKFVDDVTVEEDTIFTSNAIFTKIWLVRNMGTCTWNDEFDLVFDGGDRMGPKVFDFPDGRVRPGESVEISAELTAPDDEGRQRSFWMLKSDRGDVFGVGEDGEDPLTMQIRVVESSGYAYDFGINYCSAQWRSNAGQLGCPGVKGDEDGFVLRVEKPELEFDRLENEAGLWTQPADSRDGWIRGEYPGFNIEAGHRFRAVVGCLSDSPKCDVIFQLNYRIGDGNLQTLWEHRETYDDNITKVDVDLSSLVGQKVKFVLTVLVNDSPKDDRAFWLVPRIAK